MLIDAGIATVRRNHNHHLDRRPIYVQVGLSVWHRIAWAAAKSTGMLTCALPCEHTTFMAVL